MRHFRVALYDLTSGSADEVIEPPKYQVKDAPGWPIATIVLGVLMLIAGWIYALARSGRLSPRTWAQAAKERVR